MVTFSARSVHHFIRVQDNSQKAHASVIEVGRHVCENLAVIESPSSLA